MHHTYGKVWDSCLEHIKSLMNPQSFKTWFEGTIALPSSNGTLVLRINNRFTADWIEKFYMDFIDNVLDQVTGSANHDIVFAIPQGEDSYAFIRPATEKRESNKKKVKVKHDHLNPAFTFENFVVGNFNNLAHAAAMAISEMPGKNSYNPLYIYGGVGLGKTHLLQAIGNQILELDPKSRIMYVTSERFVSDYISSILSNSSTVFREAYRDIDVLLMDDVQFLSGKDSCQEQLFHLFNALHQSGKQIVLTSDRQPGRIEGMVDRLISRFKWGLVVDLKTPDLESRIAILKRKLLIENTIIEEDVLEFLAANVSSNIRALEGSLIRLLAHSSIHGQNIDISLAREVISDYNVSSTRTKTDIESIIDNVCTIFNVSRTELLGDRRTKNLALARQTGMYLTHKMTDLSIVSIGLSFKRHHSTVIHACDKVTEMIKTDSVFSDLVSKIPRVPHSFLFSFFYQNQS